jgi:hypothetical protein
VVDEADAPRQPRVDRALVAGRAAQAGQRLVPIAAELVGLPQQAIEGHVAMVVGQRPAGLDDRLDCPLAQEGGTILRQQPRGGGVIADGPPRAQRERGLAVRRVPLGGAGVQRAQLVIGQRQRGERDVAHQPGGREPRVERTGLEEEPAAGERGERVRGALEAERSAQRRVHALQRRRRPDQRAHRGRLLGEHLARQVAEQRAAGPAQALDRRAALDGRQRADGLAGQAHGGGHPSVAA